MKIKDDTQLDNYNKLYVIFYIQDMREDEIITGYRFLWTLAV